MFPGFQLHGGIALRLANRARLCFARRALSGAAHNGKTVEGVKAAQNRQHELPASESVANVKGETEGKGSLPDINSTDIGAIPDPHTHDPKKWQKFAWKYLGVLITFGVSYKALHWWVDRVEKEGKQRREDMEISKTAKYETPADRAAQREADTAEAQTLLAKVKSPLGSPIDEADNAKRQDISKEGDPAQVEPAVADTSFQVFRPVQEDEGFISQEDSLKLLEIELEARLKKLREHKQRTREIDLEKKQIKEELKDLRKELATFDSEQTTQAESSVSSTTLNPADTSSK
jgi:hypothetical protein